MPKSSTVVARPKLVPGLRREARLHVVTGKGGTGKTTVAAALALALAQGGQRVLLIEVEGRQALAQIFDVPALPYAEHHLEAVTGGGEVFGLAIDPEEAFIDYLDMFYNLRRSARALRKIGLIDFVTTLAPGVRDVLLTGKVKEAVVRQGKGSPAYDAVVLDAPPTGRIKPFLSATAEVANLAKVGPINRQSKGVVELLHSEQTQVHLVTLLEEMPVQETVEAARELTAAQYRLGLVVVNRARPRLISANQLRKDGSVDTEAIAHDLQTAGLNPAHAAPLGAQLADYARHQLEQQRVGQALAQIDAPTVTLPDLTPPVAAGELHELAQYFLADSSAGA